MSADAHVLAVLAKLNARLSQMATPRVAYEYDTVPPKAEDYVVISLTRMFGGNRRGNGMSPSMWRLTVRAVSRGTTNVRVLLDVCTTELEHQSIVVGAETSTGVQFETETDVEQDDSQADLWSGLRSFTYAF